MASEQRSTSLWIPLEVWPSGVVSLSDIRTGTRASDRLWRCSVWDVPSVGPGPPAPWASNNVGSSAIAMLFGVRLA